MAWWRLGHLGLFLLLVPCSPAVPNSCDVCGGTLGYTAYTVEDQVDHRKKWVCDSCADLPTTCYVCGVPTRDGFLTLTDGRVVCKRDRVDVVVDETEARRICAEVNERMQSLFSRFTRFPATNVHLHLADRVGVRALIGLPGNDVQCPNLLGYAQSVDRSGHPEHHLRVLTGLKRGILRATYAHELAHAWVAENVSPVRQLQIHPDAREGFCELIGYRVAESYRDEAAMRYVLENQYTRGQVHLFIESCRRFGMAEVLDWMQYGETGFLVPEDPQAIRAVSGPTAPAARPASEILFIPRAPVTRPETLEVTSITVSPNLSIATINGRAFEVNEERKVPLGRSNVVLRCLAVAPDGVWIQHIATGRKERLMLRSRSEPSGGTPNGHQ